jgi:hypothetical protein
VPANCFSTFSPPRGRISTWSEPDDVVKFVAPKCAVSCRLSGIHSVAFPGAMPRATWPSPSLHGSRL